MSKPLLIAMMGLPRSGKSSVVELLSKEIGAPIVRRDAIRLALHGHRFQMEAEPMIKAMSIYMIRSLFLAGHDTVICDETNYSQAARDSIQSEDWQTMFFPITTGPLICCERAEKTGQPDLVKVIWEMANRYEPLKPTDVRYNEVYVNLTDKILERVRGLYASTS